MHDVLYENQDRLADDFPVKYAKEIDLAIEQFKSDFEAPEYIEKVESDFESGVRSGVNGTPSFFINGEKYNDSWDEETLLNHLQELIR